MTMKTERHSKYHSSRLALTALAITVVASLIWLLLPSNEAAMLEGESIHSDSSRMRLLLAEGALTTGLSVSDYKQRIITEDRDHRIAAASAPDFATALEKNDQKAASEALKTLKSVNLDQEYPGILSDIIEAGNYPFLELALREGIPCQANTRVGQQAIATAANHLQKQYLELLISPACELQNQSDTSWQTTAELISRSPYPERLLDLPASKRTGSTLNRAFSRSLSTADEELLQAFIDAGANTNASDNNKSLSPLQIVLERNMTKLALILIENGANVDINKDATQSVLMLAFETGYVELYELILERNREKLKKDHARSQLYDKLMELKESAIRLSAFEYLQQAGLLKSPDETSSKTWLSQAMSQGDPDLMKVFLQSGFTPRNRERSPTLSSQARQLDETMQQSFLALLQEYDLDKSDQRNLTEQEIGERLSNCSIGEPVMPLTDELYSADAESEFVFDSDELNGNQTVHHACLIAMKSCMNQGHGSDDCMFSAPVCDTSNDIDTPCCPEKMIQQYTQSRCLGEGSIDILEYFSSPYYDYDDK